MRAALLVGLWLAACGEPQWHASGAPGSDRSVYSHAWVWTDDQGQELSLARWRGTPLVVTAVYTSCVATCPRTLAKLRQLYDQYTRDGTRAEFVVVTLDPSHDGPDELRTYRAAHQVPAAWHLLRGGEQQTAQLGSMLDIHPMAMDEHLVHESRIIVFDGNGVSRAVLDVL
jgi:protein SCO1/2